MMDDLDLTERQLFFCANRHLNFREMLQYSDGQTRFINGLLYKLQLALQRAETLLPQNPTRRETSEAQLLRQQMTELKARLESMLPFIEDWAESDVAMLGNGRGSHTTTHLDPQGTSV